MPIVSGYTLPPAIYDHQPNMPVIEHILSHDEVNKACSPLLPPLMNGQQWLGCATRKYEGSKPICIVYRVNNDLVLRHEQGHCNGWPADHQIKETRPILPLPWPKTNSDTDTLKDVLTITKEISSQIRR